MWLKKTFRMRLFKLHEPILFVLLTLIVGAKPVYSVNYTTTGVTAWNGCAGWTPGCPPTTVPVGDSIFIYHSVTTSSNLTINGKVLIFGTGALSGTHTIKVNPSGKLNNDGTISTNKLVTIDGNYTGSGMFTADGLDTDGTMNGGGNFTFTNDVILTGTFTYNSGTLIADKFTVGPAGEFTNSGRVYLSEDLHIDGLVTNNDYIEAFDSHIDGELCNADSFVIAPGEIIDLHGGWIHCGGFLGACEIKMHENGGTDPILEEQNSCCDPGGTPPTIDYSEGTIDSGTVAWCSSFLRPMAPLPIELLAFHAEQVENQIVIKWSTATETGNQQFEIERYGDGEEWIWLGIMTGAGYSNWQLDYEFVDEKPLFGENYYRLRQVDYDGNFEEFGPVVTDFSPVGKNEILVKPIFVNDQLQLFIESFRVAIYKVQLVDVTGRILLSKNLMLAPGIQQFTFLVQGAQSQFYILNMQSLDKQYSQKLVRQ